VGWEIVADERQLEVEEDVVDIFGVDIFGVDIFGADVVGGELESWVLVGSLVWLDTVVFLRQPYSAEHSEPSSQPSHPSVFPHNR
jgi:hypothetical protein